MTIKGYVELPLTPKNAVRLLLSELDDPEGVIGARSYSVESIDEALVIRAQTWRLVLSTLRDYASESD